MGGDNSKLTIIPGYYPFARKGFILYLPARVFGLRRFLNWENMLQNKRVYAIFFVMVILAFMVWDCHTGGCPTEKWKLIFHRDDYQPRQ